MRGITCLLLLAGTASCGNDSTTHGEDGATTDAASTDGAVGCPTPVNCGDADATICDLPPPAPIECLQPYVDFYRWTECSNGYVVITRAAENSGIAWYYRDSKLVAVFAGHLTLTCRNGPVDFVRPECTAVRSIDLCAKDASFPVEEGLRKVPRPASR